MVWLDMARKSKRLLAVWYSRTHQDTAAVRADGLWVNCCILVFEQKTADVPMVVIGCWPLRPWLSTLANTYAMVFQRIGQSVALLSCDAVVQQLSNTCQLHQRSCSGSVAGATCPSNSWKQHKPKSGWRSLVGRSSIRPAHVAGYCSM